MKMMETKTKKPYFNVIFGNFYCPAYDDEQFVDETMELIRDLGFNSVMFDTKAWEDFRERYETGALSQYVKMQEYMGRSALAHGLTYNFLLLYLNGDNLYPHIRFSPPIFGEETVKADGSPGKWYKYWSDAAKASMQAHVERIMDSYKDGCTRCEDGEHTVIPVCSMWDPIVAPSFDEEGIRRYTEFLRKTYGGDIAKLNRVYGTEAEDFSELKPEDYWYELRYDVDLNDLIPDLDVDSSEDTAAESRNTFFTEEDVKKQTAPFVVWRDNARWKIEELTLYFQDMQTRLKEKNPELFLCPDMTQWGYFLNIYGRSQCDHDNDFSQLWDTAMRGIDIYALAPYVDSCHFITVPTTPDGVPDAYVTSCQHSMMRVMNEGKTFIGGTYWGRFIYNDLYAQLSPAEIIATMTACGIDGYTCYGMNGLDDGGVMNRMDGDFLDSLRVGNDWCARVLERRQGARRKEIALLFPSEMAHYEPYEVGNNKIRRLDLLGWYKICCDLGYQADVISSHEILRGALDDYRVLIVPANDCYGAEDHEQMERQVIRWVKNGGVLLHGPQDSLAENCFDIRGEACPRTPYRCGKVVIPQGVEFCRYSGGKSLADYVDGQGQCVVMYEKDELTVPERYLDKQAAAGGEPKTMEGMKGTVYSFGVQMGASYAAKNIPHVPYEQSNKEMYPIRQARTGLFEEILTRHVALASRITERGIETGVFGNGMVIVNHRSTPYVLPEKYAAEDYQYPAGRDEKGHGILMPHTAVWVET